MCIASGATEIQRKITHYDKGHIKLWEFSFQHLLFINSYFQSKLFVQSFSLSYLMTKFLFPISDKLCWWEPLPVSMEECRVIHIHVLCFLNTCTCIHYVDLKRTVRWICNRYCMKKRKKDPSQFDKKWSMNNKIKWKCFLKQLVSNGPLNIHVHVWCIPGKNVFKCV